MNHFLRDVERRTMAEHEERLATVVLAEARAESERIRQRAGQQRSTPKPPTQRTEKRCAECDGRTRAANGVCADCIAARSEALVAAVRALHYGATVPQVAEALGVSFAAAEKRLGRAVKAGTLRRVRHGLYALGEVKP